MRSVTRSIALVGVLAISVSVLVVVALATATPVPVSCPNQALRVGMSAGLPDCRAYEQVSPVEKGSHNAVEGTHLTPAQAAVDGARVFYIGLNSFPGAEGNTSTNAGHLSVRTADGWRTVELTPHTATLGPEREGLAYYQPVSEELSQVLIKGPEVLTAAANPFAYNLYVRELSSERSWTSPEYTWVNAAPLPEPATELCDGLSTDASCGGSVGFAGASENLSHVLFESRIALVSPAPASGIEALYENAGGAIRLVGVLPDKTVAMNGSTAGGGVPTAGEANHRVEHAISGGGERVVFEAESDEGEPSVEKGQSGMTEVYDRIDNSTADPSTIELSSLAPGASPKVDTAEPATFWAASADGSRVFFTSKAELTTASNTGAADNSEDLYEYDLNTKSLQDLSVDTNPLDAASGAGVLGVVGASEDGEYVYFVADGQLVEGKGVDGKPNLYMERDDSKPVFVATLQPANTTSRSTEEHEPGDSLDWAGREGVQRAYVTPDGMHVGFMSVVKLSTLNFPSGYENKSDSEVYEYTAPSPGEEAQGKAGGLVCASCDPTGAAPSGSAFIAGTGMETNGFTPVGASNLFHHVRALSDNGTRVFFEAPPFASETVTDSEETQTTKVFEYEQDSEGSCTSADGCVYRISAANNPVQDLFLDASATGDDVFFSSYSQLASSDRDDLVDVYDARVDGGFPASEPVGECESGCRSSSSSPDGPPLVSGMSGPSGNVSTVMTMTISKKPTTVKQGTCAVKPKKTKNKKNPKRANKRGRASRKCSVATRKHAGHHAHDMHNTSNNKGRKGQ